MIDKYAVSAVILAAALAGVSPLSAQSFEFNGTRENVSPATPPGGRCVPQYANTVNVAPGNISSTGTSNLGTFTSTQSFCVTGQPPTPLADGRFTYTFRAGDTIFGTYSGNAAATSTPGTFAAVENLVIAGGTGRFTGASGTLTSSGPLRLGTVSGAPVSIFQGSIIGSLQASQNVEGEFGTALGGPAAATGLYSTSIGAFSTATAERGVAVGSFAESTGVGAVALGDVSLATGPAAMALGQGAQATAPAASAVGHNTVASGIGSLAAGVRAQASGLNATALGSTASATFAGSTAVGQRAATTAANQVALGATGSSVRVGDIAASTAAQTGTVSVATVDANGTLGSNGTIIPAIAALQASSGTQTTQIAALQAAGSAMQAQLGELFNLADVNRKGIQRANEGVAMALAMDSPSLSPGSSFALSGGVGMFGSRMAGTAAFSARVGATTAFSAGVGVGFNSGKVGARAGFQTEW
ncbi:MAG TPA: hypothetical protein VF662_12920 [Allosphingosinicella sp.]|jgi:hypothetical protein